MTPEAQLQLGADLELTDEDLAGDVVDAAVIELGETPLKRTAVAAAVDPLAARNLFGEADRIAARASSASTRKQYAAT